MTTPQFLSSEKAILQHKLETCEALATDVEPFEPAHFPNPVGEDRIGRYRPLDSTMYVTAEMKTIIDCCISNRKLE